MKVVGWNACSLRRKIAEFSLFLAQSTPDIVFVFEPWFDNTFTTVQFTDYIEHVFPNRNGHSGILILVRNTLSHSVRSLSPSYSDTKFSSSSMFRCIEVKAAGYMTPQLFAGFYAAPDCTAADWQMIFDCMLAGSDLHLPFFIVSDANAHSVDWGSNSHSSNRSGAIVSSFIGASEFVVLNSSFSYGQPTCSRGISSVIDLGFTNCSGLVESFTVLGVHSLSSDHSPISISLTSPNAPHPVPAPVRTSWDLEHGNWELYRSILSTYLINWSASFSSRLSRFCLGSTPLSSMDLSASKGILESAWSELRRIILSAASFAIPKKTVRPNSKHWWSYPTVKTAYDRLCRARRRYYHRRHNHVDHLRLQAARTEWHATVKQAKRSAVDDLAKRICASHQHRLLYAYMRRYGSPPPNPLASIKSPSGQLPATPAEAINNLALVFAKLFAAVPDAGHCPATTAKVRACINDAATVHSACPELDPCFAVSDVAAQCARISANSAVDPQDIAPAFIHHSPPSLHVALTSLFNFSWTTGLLCDEWKLARGFPLFKGKGKDPADPDSYRLISITSIVVRVFERCIFRRLMSFLESHNFFSAYQFGFRPHRSTYDPLLLLYHFIHSAFAQNSYLPVAFLDIKKAFDSVWHEGLLYKLFQAGVTGRCWRWIAGFLRNRKFFIAHQGVSSDLHDITASVPQGSVLAALLFIIFINDLPLRCTNCFAPLFADDVALWPRFSGSKGIPDLISSFSSLSTWAFEWRLHFAGKSTIVVFCRKRTRPTLPPLRLESFILPVESRYLYMGVLLHESLSWDPFFESQRKKLLPASFAISHLISRDRAPSAGLVGQLVRSFMISRIAYALPFWQPTKKHLQSLQSIIATPLRRALCLHPHTHTLSVLAEYNISSISCLRQYLQLKAALRFLSLPRSNIASRVFIHALITSNPHEHWSPKALTRRAMKQLYEGHLATIDRDRPDDPQPVTDQLLAHITSIISSIPWISETHVTSESWSVPLIRASSYNRLPYSLSLRESLREWQVSTHGRHLFAFYQPRLYQQCHAPLTDSHEQSYLWSEGRPDQINRALLRFDAAALNESLSKRHLAASPFCTHCLSLPVPARLTESVEHVLISCPKYAVARVTLVTAINSVLHNVPLSLDIILDPLHQHLPPQHQSLLLSVSSTFIRSVFRDRF